MNNRSSNLKIIEELFNSNKIKKNLLEALLDFFNRIPTRFLENTRDRISCMDMAGAFYKICKIKNNPRKHILIEFGNLDDLRHSSIIGLIAHLFALIQIGYHENPGPKGEEWLKVDLYSDEVAKKLGFKSEVENLRKIRPQKIPDEVRYPDIVIDYSTPNKKFNTDIRSVFSEYNKFLLNKNLTHDRVWYVDKFSMICNLRDLCKSGTESLHIFTNKYTRGELKRVLCGEEYN